MENGIDSESDRAENGDDPDDHDVRRELRDETENNSERTCEEYVAEIVLGFQEEFFHEMKSV
jgi:hypothetical protein